MKPLFVDCSDTHLRSRRGDEEHAFAQIISAAVALNLPLVSNGDNLDKQSNRARVVTTAYRELDRLHEIGKKFYYIQGQHDFDDPPWFAGHPAAVHLHKTTVEIGGFTLYGLDWQPFGKLQDELAEIPPEVNVLVCHQVWGDWMGDIAAPQGEFAQIPYQIRHVLTGDLHQWKLETHRNAGGDKMQVVSCGATTQQKIDEPDKHYYAVFYDDGTVERKKLKSRVFHDAGLIVQDAELDRLLRNLEPTLATLVQKGAAMDLPPNLMTPVIRVTYSAKLPETKRRVEKVVGDRAVLHFTETPPEERTSTYAKSADKGEAVTPISVLADEVNREETPLVYELCERLLGASDIDMEFAAWRQEFLDAK